MKAYSKLFALFLVACTGTIILSGCGERVKTIYGLKGDPGADGRDGVDGVSMGVDIVPSAPSCAAGGITVRSFADLNSNNIFDLTDLIKQTSVVCNGLDGSDGQDGADGTSATITVRQATPTECSTGGYVLDSSTSATDAIICNGNDGSTGPQGPQGLVGAQGPQGIQGIPGINGVDGQDGRDGNDGAPGSVGATGPQGPAGPSGGIGNVTPIQLCPGDTSSFPEQGLIIGNNLYAVYYGNLGSGLQAFFAKLNPGSYVTTNGSNCQFTYSNNGTNLFINGNQVTSNSTNQYRIDQYTNPNNTNNLVATYIVTNAGQVNWTISPSTGHGFTINNNANNLSKANCNINNLTSVTTSQTFENCIVTKLQ